jgi:hypothetical protein
VDGGIDDSRKGDLPWASVFDSGANMRALSAIQAEGFRAARELVDRVVRTAADGLNGSVAPASPDASTTGQLRADLFGATDVEPLIRSWWSTVGQLLVGSSVPAPDTAPAAPTLDLSTEQSTGQLHLEAQVDGATAAEVWLHNMTAKDLGDVYLRCSDLLAGDGCVIDSSAVTFDPAPVLMCARSSRGVGVKIKASRADLPGLYRGTLLVEGHPKLWMPVELTVK